MNARRPSGLKAALPATAAIPAAEPEVPAAPTGDPPVAEVERVELPVYPGTITGSLRRDELYEGRR